MSSFRKGLSIRIPIHKFQSFNKGGDIELLVPVNWNLKPGDRLEYEVNFNTPGSAEVVSVGSRRGDKISCTFKKVIKS